MKTVPDAEGVAGPVAEAAPVVDTDLAPPIHAALTPAVNVVVAEPFTYRLKRRLLGKPLATEELSEETLGKPTALAVFASDNLSSSAYATEEILRVLVPVIGIAAFSLVVPVTIALLVVLGFLILSYRQTIKAYPSSGGAYVVTKDNLGKVPALVAGVSLLTDYVLTVAVSVAAGTAAIASALPGVEHVRVELSVFFVALIAFGNLRGVRESGKVFAVPTYFFLVNMGLLLVVGGVRLVTGHLPVDPLGAKGLVHVGSPGTGLLYGAALFVVLKAFASGGAAVTGVEAISNGVTAFKEPAWKNARATLVVMGSLLGVMFLGLSVLAAHTHAAPFIKGTPTVISQVGKLVYGTTPVGHVLFYALQVGTTLILILAANTSFADFPRLASYAAADRFLPRQLNKRGHRLVFSNGILSLAGAAAVLVVATNAQVDRLIPLYAIGVFTSFTFSQGGMAKHHLRLREEGWRSGLFINGTGAVLSFVVDVIIAVTKFKGGGWVIIVAVPLLVLLLIRLNRQYEEEADELSEDAPRAAEAPILRRHVVLVLVDGLDLAAARAIQYARSLMPDQLRTVHFAVDAQRADELRTSWSRLGLSRVPLDVVECPDRRITRAAVELVAELVGRGDTEVSVLIPRIVHDRAWHKLLHDRTSDAIAAAMGVLPHANVTFVPYHLGRKRGVTIDQPIPHTHPAGPAEAATPSTQIERVDGTLPIGEVRFRQHVTVAGRVRSIRTQPRAGVPTLECVLDDGTGRLTLVFLGRRTIAGFQPGVQVSATAVVGERGSHLEMLNPSYQFLQPVSTR